MKILALHKPSSAPFKAIFPAFIGFTILALKRTLQKIFLHTLSNLRNDGSQLNPQKEAIWFIETVFEVLESIGDTIFASYNSYFAFVLMMLFVNLIIHRSDIKKYFLAKKENILARKSAEKKELLRSLLKSFLVYSLIYCIYQVMWNYIAAWFLYGGFSLQKLHEVKIQEPTTKEIMPMLFSGRILEAEGQLSIDQPNIGLLRKKPSLSIGKVMSEIDVIAYSTRLSKDKKTLFVGASYPPALQIIDVSDSEYPVVLSSLALSREYVNVAYKSMVVSPDETKIYISNFETLEIVDISDLKSPVYLAKIKDNVIFKSSETNGIFEPNLIISRDGKSLFASGFGLQIFDISQPKTPVLVRSAPSRIYSEKLLPSSIALSQDGKTLYYTDGSFWIYNVEDPKDIKLIDSFEPTNIIFSSMMLSKDHKTAFVLSLDEESKILLQKLDISDINTIKQGEIIQLDQVSRYTPLFLNQTPDNLFLLIRYWGSEYGVSYQMLIFDTQEGRVVNHEKNLIKNDLSVLFTDDYKKVFIGKDEKLQIVDLYLDFPNKNTFSNSSNIIQTLNTQMRFEKVDFAYSNENTLYSVSNGESFSQMRFGIHKLSSDQFTNTSFYETEDEIKEMTISQDNKRAFLVGSKAMYILDISNSDNVTLMSKYEIEKDRYYYIESFLLSRDGKTGFLIYTILARHYLRIIDFSNPMNSTQKGVIDVGDDPGILVAVLSKDERSIFIASRNLDVYNISDHSSPNFLARLTFLVDQKFMLGTPEIALSPDGKTLFLKDASVISSFSVHIVDVSNVTSPQLRCDFRFPAPESGLAFEGHFFAVSGDSRTFYILRDFSLMTLDVSNTSSPRYLGAMKIDKEKKDQVRGFKLSQDGRKVYFFTKNKKCHIASLEPVYTTFVREDVLLLGERYSLDLEVLKMNKNMEYNQLEGEYRFTKFGLVESRSIKNPNFEDIVLKPAPSWMHFDLKSQVLTVESGRKSDLGAYRVYYAFSTRLPKNAFSRMNDTEDLFAVLLGLGYVDNQLFLTENFGEYEDFILPLQYFYVKEQIYQILKQYSFETFNELTIVQSLSLGFSDSNKLKISTASLSSLKVEINLEGGGQAKFLSRYYGSLLPTITNEKSRLVLEGGLKDINLALQEIVVHSVENARLSDGQISVYDKLNPIVTVSMKNISRYFNKNLPPGRNDTFPLTIQNQIDKEITYTGKYFQIKLKQQAFSDKYTLVENLNYHIALIKDNNETVLPSWLSFSDMTLMGTPPESLFGREFDLMLVVKNEFQEFKEPIKLNVRISSTFILSLLLKYSPYILTILGLYIKANLIYNVLAKKKYKHMKDFYVRIGEEISPEVIFPVSFVAEEIQEAKKILKFLEKKFGNKGKLLSYFSEKKLNKITVSETIKETLNELTYKEQEGLGFYLDGHRPRTRIVDQIVFNMLIMEMLLSKKEKETRVYYEKVKKQWPEFVDWDLENSCFKINNQKFENILLQNEKSDTILTSFIQKSNIDLLKDAILAFAFDCQNIDTSPASVQFKVREKAKGGCLKRFAKLDLEDCPFTEKGKIGYGMTYHKDYNTLFFDGVVKPDIQRKTIVFQITNLQQKILKELWIIGDGNLLENESYIKGKEYQIL